MADATDKIMKVEITKRLIDSVYKTDERESPQKE